jgi:predicted nuclease of predicted toxin-antitoxin system
MKFIIDENLPPILCSLFRAANLEAYHVNEMKARQKQRVADDQLRRLAIQKNYVIVTKDDDFVKSFVSRKVPEKVVFIYGINEKESLLSRLKEVIPLLSYFLKSHDFIEVNEREIRFPFS